MIKIKIIERANLKKLFENFEKMPSSKVEPFFAKVSSKKLTSEFNYTKVLLMIIIGCFSVALIIGIVFIIIFSAGYKIIFVY